MARQVTAIPCMAALPDERWRPGRGANTSPTSFRTILTQEILSCASKLRSWPGSPGVLLASGGAFAQSHQGGYLGSNPGAHVAPRIAAPAAKGSGQGGYLGLSPGGHQAASTEPLIDSGSGQGGYLGLNPGLQR